ncbi:MFS transporter [Candidatus Thorarchaeota archaeon]|jgi:OFA family oxalate/formate antiporter-like MFS transporter|nr:MAG: MFS transporter [Candidatus Thorarchaeota archaeon]
MMSENVGNRYLVMLGAIIVQLCLGTIYAWSEFQNALKLAASEGGLYGWLVLNTQWPFAAGLASFAVFMVFAGRWQDKVGPRKVATIGGVLLGLGYMLASLVDILALDEIMGTLYLVLTYGVIGGAGIGFAYVCPIAALVKWFPDKKGSVSGIAVAGFGGGALIFLYVEQYLIESAGGFIGQPFLILGIVYLIGVILGAQVLTTPPEGWVPEGWTPPETTADGSGKGVMPGEMIKTGTFWLLWLAFIFAATAGLMTLGNVKSAAAEVDPLVELLGLGALIGGIMSIFNAAGRIVWGAASDKLGRVMTMMLMFLILAIAMFGFAYVVTLPQAEGMWMTVTVVASIVGFCFGGNFALFPSATADYFGSKNVGKNYGVVFTAYGIAGVVGALVAGSFVDLTQSYFLAFVATGILAILAIILTIVMKIQGTK